MNNRWEVFCTMCLANGKGFTNISNSYYPCYSEQPTEALGRPCALEFPPHQELVVGLAGLWAAPSCLGLPPRGTADMSGVVFLSAVSHNPEASCSRGHQPDRAIHPLPGAESCYLYADWIRAGGKLTGQQRCPRRGIG